jgi:hypothetical protein
MAMKAGHIGSVAFWIFIESATARGYHYLFPRLMKCGEKNNAR